MRKVVGLLLVLLVFSFLSMATVYFLGIPLLPVVMTGHVTETSGLVKLYVGEGLKIIIIYSPENVTYDFSDYICSGAGWPKCDNYRYILPLNVSADFPVEALDGWKYSLYDLRHDIFIEEDTVFDPNSSISAVRWGNQLTVYANEEDGDWESKVVVFTVEVPNSDPVLGEIEDPLFVCESERINDLNASRFNATDVDEDVLNEDISPKKPFYTKSLGGGGVDPSLFQIVSAPLGKGELGSHMVNISVMDSGGIDSASVNISVIEINNPPVITALLGAQTVWLTGVNSTFNHQVLVSDREDKTSNDGNLEFNLTWENNENLFDINSSTGVMNYVPLQGHCGRTFSLEVCVKDNPLTSVHENFSVCSARGHSSDSVSVCDEFTLTVTDDNRAPEIVNYSPPVDNFSVRGTAINIFSVNVSDDDGTIPDIDWYVDGILKEHNENKSSDNYSYSFGCGVSGIHSVRIITSDGLLNDSHTWSINVIKVDCPVESSLGGGGGSGSLGGICQEKWVCEDWDVCQNAKRSFDAKILSPEDYYLTKELCAQNQYDERFCGFQITRCYDLNFCNNSVLKLPKPSEMRVCYFTENPNCIDGITNCHDGGCELLVDCGGPCPACATCSDGIQNQGEAGVDCGGPCPYVCEREKPLKMISFALIVLSILGVILLIYILYRLF